MAHSNCSTVLRLLRRAENRRRMSAGTAQAINAHFTACDRCDKAQGYSFRKRYSTQLGIEPKVRPWKPLKQVPSAEELAAHRADRHALDLSTASLPSMDGTAPPPDEKPKRARKSAATGTPKPRRRRSKTAPAVAAAE